jgi:hypothetical protein
MRRQYSVAALVYSQIFPNPSPSDPPDFSAHLIRNLITEVRIETQRFYGGLDTIEAKYPGLNYSHNPHRKRLSRFPHHARLFRAFDDLGLTPYEIGQLCKWEGTLWARQRYERDEGVVVRDTAGDEIRPWVDRRVLKGGRKRNPVSSGSGIKVKTDIEVEIVEVSNVRLQRQHTAASTTPHNTEGPASPLVVDHGESDEEDIESVGIELNQRLIAAAAAREQQPNSDIIMDPAYEAYLKEAAEAGTLRRPSAAHTAMAIPAQESAGMQQEVQQQ